MLLAKVNKEIYENLLEQERIYFIQILVSNRIRRFLYVVLKIGDELCPMCYNIENV